MAPSGWRRSDADVREQEAKPRSDREQPRHPELNEGSAVEFRSMDPHHALGTGTGGAMNPSANSPIERRLAAIVIADVSATPE